MLVGVFIITNVMIEIIGISQKQIIFCKNIRTTHIDTR